jgi:hypothetical protein
MTFKYKSKVGNYFTMERDFQLVLHAPIDSRVAPLARSTPSSSSEHDPDLYLVLPAPSRPSSPSQRDADLHLVLQAPSTPSSRSHHDGDRRWRVRLVRDYGSVELWSRYPPSNPNTSHDSEDQFLHAIITSLSRDFASLRHTHNQTPLHSCQQTVFRVMYKPHLRH